jgi:hypothetical protein
MIDFQPPPPCPALSELENLRPDIRHVWQKLMQPCICQE